MTAAPVIARLLPSTGLARIALAAFVMVAGLAANRLALPGAALACSCVAPNPGAPVFSGEEQAVFIGTAGQPQPDGTFRFTVERWFVGGTAAEVAVMSDRVVFDDGSTTIDTCGLHFEVGDRLLLSASFSEGVYRPGSCQPHAAVASDEGQALLSAAVARFGQGSSPGPPVDTPAPDDPDLAGLALGLLGIVVLVVVITVVAAARRRREEAPPA